MPNWCECDLYIIGPEADIKACLASVKGKDSIFEFDMLVPYPEHYRILDEAAEKWMQEFTSKRSNKVISRRPNDGFNNGGFDWCLTNWGTKWDTTGASIVRRKPGNIKITFETAWSPPKPIIKVLSTKFPKLKIRLRYFECGMAFKGTFTCHKSEIIKDESTDYTG